MPILVVEVVALRTPPELSAEEHVSDVTTGERALEGLAIELRRESRPWARPHIHDRLDGVLFEQSDNVIGLVVRMADRVDAEGVFAHSPIVADQADGCLTWNPTARNSEKVAGREPRKLPVGIEISPVAQCPELSIPWQQAGD